MIVLFLGGPCHNERRDVQRPLPERIAIAATSAVSFNSDDHDPVRQAVPAEHYELRSAAPAGVYPPGWQPEFPVYVHPNYDGPVRW